MNEMACNELVEAITTYLDGGLSDSDRRRFEAHIAECSACAEYLAQMRKTISHLGRIDETAALSDATRDGIIAAFHDRRT